MTPNPIHALEITTSNTKHTNNTFLFPKTKTFQNNLKSSNLYFIIYQISIIHIFYISYILYILYSLSK